MGLDDETKNISTWKNVSSSAESSLEPGYVIWLKAAAYFGIFLTSLIGNCLVIAAYKLNLNRKIRTVSNTFIVSMAAADLSITLASVPERITRVLASNQWLLPGTLGVVTCKLVNFIEKLSLNVSVLHLASIAIDRFLVVFYPRRKIITRVRRSTPTITEIYAFDHFVELVEKIERNVTGLHNVANHIRSLGYNDAYWQNLIGTAPALPNGILSSIEKAVLTKMVAHRYDGSRELGVVRLPSGETIAIGHVINGIAAGIYRDFEKSLKPWVPGATKIVDNLYAATLARDLAETALAKKNNPSNSYFGPGGSWKSDECPAIYTRTSNGVYSDEASDAELLGDLRGIKARV
ncbi:hypothetical protein QZH41_000898 [Actinostola sp. cb2023]|nr:hypothetical protein QZH41_000898 [Actinostola sp. cb2023]